MAFDTRNDFDKCMDLAKLMLEKGYTKAWFTWLEWVTITAFFLALGVKVTSVFLIIMSFLSGVLLFFTGLQGAMVVINEHRPTIEKKVSKNMLIFLFLIVIVSVPWAVFSVLMSVLEASFDFGGT